METQRAWRRRALFRWMAACSIAVLCLTACNRTEDTETTYTKAIDAYYSSHPSCIWSQAVQFPAQQDATDAVGLAQYNALAEDNLLSRTAPSPAVRVASAPAQPAFDLTSAGRTAWVSDPQQPGYGNLCYGHRKVLALDSTTPGPDGATTAVVYRYTMTDVPGWAKSQAVQAAFHGMQADLSGRQVGRATLENTPHGWVVKEAPWAHIDDSDIYH